MHVTADRIGSGHGLQGLDRRDTIVETFAVETDELPFLESQRNAARFALLELRGVSLFGQRLARSERLLAAYRRAPNALVDRIFRLFKVEIDAVRAQVADLLFAAEAFLADQRDHFNLRCDDVEHHIETHLVVTGARTAVAKVIGSDLLGIFGNGRRLRHTLGADRNRISGIFQHIAEDHVFDCRIVIVLRHIERYVALHAQIVGAFLDFREFLGRKAAGVGQCGMNLEAHLLGQIYCAVGRVEPTAKCQYNFFLFHFRYFLSY